MDEQGEGRFCGFAFACLCDVVVLFLFRTPLVFVFFFFLLYGGVDDGRAFLF